MDLERFTASDNASAFHVTLELSGHLDHPLSDAEIQSWRRLQYFDTAPDGNSDEVAARFAGS